MCENCVPTMSDRNVKISHCFWYFWKQISFSLIMRHITGIAAISLQNGDLNCSNQNALSVANSKQNQFRTVYNVNKRNISIFAFHLFWSEMFWHELVRTTCPTVIKAQGQNKIDQILRKCLIVTAHNNLFCNLFTFCRL